MDDSASNTFDFKFLPSLVFTKVLRLLSVNFNDIRNLSHVSKEIRDLVLRNLNLFYIPFATLQNVTENVDSYQEFDLKKGVLGLKIVSSSDAESGSELPLTDTNIPQNKPLYMLLYALNLRNLRSLELRNSYQNFNGYKRLLKYLPRNVSLCCPSTLEQLKMDVHLINLSEIRNSLVDVLYQHDDFLTGGPITNIDYIANSAVSQVLFNFLQFIDDLFSNSKSDHGDSYGRCCLKELEINFISEENSDWNCPELERENLNRTEVKQLRQCLDFMIKEFNKRFKLNAEITQTIIVKGIPNSFFGDIFELVDSALDEATLLWPLPKYKRFKISEQKYDFTFDLTIHTNVQGYEYIHASTSSRV